VIEMVKIELSWIFRKLYNIKAVFILLMLNMIKQVKIELKFSRIVQRRGSLSRV